MFVHLFLVSPYVITNLIIIKFVNLSLLSAKRVYINIAYYINVD